MKFKKILDIFPTPKFLDISFSGLSISDSTIHCIKFGKKNRGLFIEKHAEKNIPIGVINSGQINNKEELTSILSSLKKDLDLSFVRASLPEEKAYLFTMKIPVVKQSEVKAAIESKIEENVPVSVSELIFDYKLVDYSKKGYLSAIVSALPISIIDTYVDVANNAGLELLSLEIESQSIARALLPKGNLDTVLIVNFGKEKVGLYVVNNRIVHFTSTVVLKGESLNNPASLSQEIKRLYIYWHTLKENAGVPERKINKIIVCGEDLKETFIPYISAHNQSPVILGNVWENVFDIDNIVPEISFSDSLRYATAIGLALPSDVLI